MRSQGIRKVTQSRLVDEGVCCHLPKVSCQMPNNETSYRFVSLFDNISGMNVVDKAKSVPFKIRCSRDKIRKSL